MYDTASNNKKDKNILIALFKNLLKDLTNQTAPFP